jgi:hypothetical protein
MPEYIQDRITESIKAAVGLASREILGRINLIDTYQETRLYVSSIDDYIQRWERQEISTTRLFRDVLDLVKDVCESVTSTIRQGLLLDETLIGEFNERVATINRISERHATTGINITINTTDDSMTAVVVVTTNNYIRRRRRDNVHASIKRTSEYLKEITLTMKEEEETSKAVGCPVCFDEISSKDAIYTNCNHPYCSSCIKDFATSIKDKTNKPCCSLCRTEITRLTFEKEEILQEVCEHLKNL